MRIWTSLTSAAAIAVAALVAQPAAAQKVTLRVADSLPGGHYVSEHLKPWMAEVTKLTDGEVQFQHFPSEQLGKAKDMLALAQAGVADVAHIQPAYISEKFPLASVLEQPGLVASSCSGTKAYWEIGQPGKVLAETEFAPNGIRLVYLVVNSPYQLLSTKGKVENLEGIKGMKLRTAGGTQDVLIRKLGAAPVRVSGPEMYEALSRGTADGVLLPLASVISYDLQKLVKFSTRTASFGTTPTMYFITEAKWKGLSEKAQKAVIEAGYRASMAACAYVDREMEAVIEKLKQAGVTVADLPDESAERLTALNASVTDEWAKALEGRGRPALATLKALEEAGASKRP